MARSSDFVPALGWRSLTPLYDGTVRLLTRERRWRGAFLAQISTGAGETILDVGCGTGSLAILMKRAAPQARVVGLDPDPEILARAQAKAEAAGVEIEWRRGFARDAASLDLQVDKAVSSLVFHQVPTAEKRAGIAAMIDAVRPGGEVHIADFARQRRWLMRTLFSVVGLVDGRANTRPNALGALEDILGGTDPLAGEANGRFATPLGEISLFSLHKGSDDAALAVT